MKRKEFPKWLPAVVAPAPAAPAAPPAPAVVPAAAAEVAAAAEALAPAAPAAVLSNNRLKEIIFR